MEVHADEEDDEQGIAHMIEHVAFLGSKKREKLLGTGARSNAYTDFHHTVFHIHSPTSSKDADDLLPSVLDALNEIAFHPKFLSSRIEKERRAILSELQMMNTIEYRVDCQLLQHLHSENKLSKRFPKGVRELPGSFQSATSSVPSGKALVYFGLLLESGVFFVFIAFTLFLPVMVVMPQKFAICFTLGCGFIIGSFFSLKGPKNQLAHMLSKERLPLTLIFLGSMISTIYVSMVRHSYVLSVVFSVVQVLSLGYYVVSYFPGGSAGMTFLTSALASSVMRCFGR